MSAGKPDTSPQLPAALADLERLLATLEPKPSRIDRDRLMFRAGAACAAARTGAPQRPASEVAASAAILGSTDRLVQSGSAAERRRWLWPMATAAAVLVACLCGALYLVERSRAPVMVTVRETVYLQPEDSNGLGSSRAPDRIESGQGGGDEAEATEPSFAARRAVPEPNTAAERPEPYTTRRGSAAGVAAWIWAAAADKAPRRAHDYFALRQLVLTRGIDALPQRDYSTDSGPAADSLRQPATLRHLMEELLPRPTRSKKNGRDRTARGGRSGDIA